MTATQRHEETAGSDAGRQAVQANRRRFESLVDDCEAALARGRLERAAVRAQLAATYAWFNHPGAFTSHRLERALVRIGEALGETGQEPAGAGTGGLLHVATRLYQTGGHTQMIANWIAADTANSHRLAVTHQATVPVPAKVRDALGDTPVLRLDEQVDGLLDRATALRRLARTADAVVLHVHPNDVVAVAALADSALGRPVLLVNHADHVFWVGASVASTVVNLRRSGERLAVERRGVPPERNAVLIRPLSLRAREQDRASARRRLGLPEERVLLVTAAAGSKYDAVDGTGFLDVLEPVLADCPEAFLVAAGPEPEGRWRVLEETGHGRALGLLPDAHPLLEAADIYVDSFPFSSLTSLLEAGALGTPTVTLRPPTDGADVLGADTPELDDHLVVARDARELHRVLGALVRDAGRRSSLGSTTAAAIHAAHAEGRWARQAAALCTSARAGGPHPASGTEDVRWDGLDQRVALVQQRTGMGQGMPGTSLMLKGHLTLRERVVLFAALAVRGQRPSVAVLVSARWSRRLRWLAARSAARRQQGRAGAG